MIIMSDNVYGLDISLKSIGLVNIDRDNRLTIIQDDSNLGLSLSSTLDSIADIGRSIAIEIPDNSIVMVDATQYRFKARKKQQEQLHSLIGAIASLCFFTSLRRVEPKEIRKALGLKASTKKEDVWRLIPMEYTDQVDMGNVSEHIKDAILLAHLYNKVETW
jgi:hypothetical protein